MALPIIYFIGGELGDFETVNGTVGHDATAGYFRDDLARAALQIDNGAVGSNYVESPISPGTSVWLSCWLRITVNSSNTARPIRLFHSTNKEIRLSLVNATTNTGAPRLFTFDGSAETLQETGGTSFDWRVLRKIDVEVQLNGLGADVIRLYVDRNLQIEVTGIDLGASTNIQKFRLETVFGGTGSHVRVSEVIVTNVPTLNMGLAIKALTGDGFHDDQTGDFEDINALAINDSAGIGLQNNGDQYSATAAALSESAEAFVWGVSFQMRGARGPEGPDRLDFGIRRGGTTIYDTQVEPGLTLGPVSPLIFLDPHTDAPWDKTNLDASEFALRAVESA